MISYVALESFSIQLSIFDSISPNLSKIDKYGSVIRMMKSIFFFFFNIPQIKPEKKLLKYLKNFYIQYN